MSFQFLKLDKTKIHSLEEHGIDTKRIPLDECHYITKKLGDSYEFKVSFTSEPKNLIDIAQNYDETYVVPSWLCELVETYNPHYEIKEVFEKCLKYNLSSDKLAFYDTREEEIIYVEAIGLDKKQFLGNLKIFKPNARFKPILIPLHKYRDYDTILLSFSEYHQEIFDNSFFILGGSMNRFSHIDADMFQRFLDHYLDVYQLIDDNKAISIYDERLKKHLPALKQYKTVKQEDED